MTPEESGVPEEERGRIPGDTIEPYPEQGESSPADATPRRGQVIGVVVIAALLLIVIVVHLFGATTPHGS